MLAILLLAFLLIKATDTLIMYHCDQVFISSWDLQDQKSLTVRWRSFLECGKDHVSFLFTYYVSQYIQFGRLWLCSPCIGENASLKIVDAPLMLTIKKYQQSLYAQQMYAKFHVVVIDSQYVVSMYNYFHLKLWGLTISDPPRYMLSEQWMT